MTAPRGTRDGLGGDSLSPAVIKGGILIFVALTLGAFLLWRGLDQDNGEIAAGDDVQVSDEGSATTVGGSTETTVGDTTTTVAGPARSNAEVTVLVANGSGLPGAAGTVTDTVAAAGYATAEPSNADFVDSTTVYYVGSDEAEAIGVAAAIGLEPVENPGVVQPMPDPAPVDDLRGATVLVVLGPDLAG